MYEIGCWYPDEAQPEYMISFTERHLDTASKILGEMLKYLLVVSPIFVFMTAVFWLSSTPVYNQGTTLSPDHHPSAYTYVQQRANAKNPALTRDVTGGVLKPIGQVSLKVKEALTAQDVAKSDAVLRASNAEMLAFITRERQKAIEKKFGTATPAHPKPHH